MIFSRKFTSCLFSSAALKPYYLSSKKSAPLTCLIIYWYGLFIYSEQGVCSCNRKLTKSKSKAAVASGCRSTEVQDSLRRKVMGLEARKCTCMMTVYATTTSSTSSCRKRSLSSNSFSSLHSLKVSKEMEAEQASKSSWRRIFRAVS